MVKKKSVKKAKADSKKSKKKTNKSSKKNNKHKKKKNGFPKQRLTTGQKLSDKLTLFAGSWTFIIIFFVFLGIWMTANIVFLIRPWDPYPFILLNLVLSCLAAVQAPIILMSQNRAAERDRHRAELDYVVNRKSEREVANMQRDLDDIKLMIKYLHSSYKNRYKKRK